MSAREQRPVPIRGRWAIVTIDEHSVQCTVPAYEHARKGRPVRSGSYAVSGYGERQIALAAEYSRQHGVTYATEADAQRAIDGDDWERELVRGLP